MLLLRALAALPLLIGAARAEVPTIAAAISLKDALTEIRTHYQIDTGRDVQFTFGSSGQLLAQIRNGAPIDAFISAAPAQIDSLISGRLANPASRRIIAGNSLVLVVPAAAQSTITDFASLADQRVRRIAIGEPRTVPAGEYALQALKSLKLDQAVGQRLVHGANVRQVLDYVGRGEVDAGLVYATDARHAADTVRVVVTADPIHHQPIEYPAVTIRNAAHEESARRFLDYLASDKARRTFLASGFSLPTESTAKPPAQ